MSTVFRRLRRRGGKLAKSRSYYGRVGGIVVNLAVSDKQTAEQTLAALIREREREAVGLVPSKTIREADRRSVSVHIEDFVADLEALGRDDEYIRHVGGRMRALVAACGWQGLRDITADSFQAWRQTQALSRKTLNEYLNAARAFCNWMVKHGRLALNPLQEVAKADVRGHQAERRALAVDEVAVLLKVAGERSVFYLAAVHTGLRRAELEGLRWADLDFTSQPPTLTVRASTAKNRRQATLPLHPELAAVLATRQPAAVGDLVFGDGLPRMRTMRADFDAAAIVRVDAQGRFADFHSLRKTFNMSLQAHGAGFTTTMNLMRHSDPRLTARTYTDIAMLPLADAVSKLPWFGANDSEKGTENGTAQTVKTGSNVSAPVQTATTGDREETLVFIDQSHDLSACVLNGSQGKMVEAGGVEPPSEMESPQPLRAYPVIDCRHGNCRQAGHPRNP